ncbi:hypothetical protein ACR9E3_08385 [Actinomycetospora sp. C-140]
MSTSSEPIGSDRLFDPVFTDPPDDAVDVVVPAPLSLAVWMDSLQHTGHAGVLAALREFYAREAATCARRVQHHGGSVLTADGSEPGHLAITHVVDERVPGVAGLRPHVHVYVGATGRAASGSGRAPVDLDLLTARADELYFEHRDRLATATTDGWGLVWGHATPRSPREIVEPAWPGLKADDLLQGGEPFCPGPWSRRQVVAGEQHLREAGAELLSAGGGGVEAPGERADVVAQRRR